LKELWSDRLIEIHIADISKLHFGLDALHSDLQILYYDLGDVHTLTSQIKEDMKFQRGISVKLNPGKVLRKMS
jgi:hypothetical protein